MTIEVEVRRWGNSYAVILPKEFVKARRIKEKDKLLLEAHKPFDANLAFGLVKRKMTGQQAKDLARQGWG